MATALVCAGAIAITGTSASARPDNGCTPATTYDIIMPFAATTPMRTTLVGPLVKGPKVAKLSVGQPWAVGIAKPTNPKVTPDLVAIINAANQKFDLDVSTGWSGNTKTGRSQAVPRGQVRRMQLYKMGRKFVVKKYAPNKNNRCLHGALLYTETVTAPVASNNIKYFWFGLRP